MSEENLNPIRIPIVCLLVPEGKDKEKGAGSLFK